MSFTPLPTGEFRQAPQLDPAVRELKLGLLDFLASTINVYRQLSEMEWGYGSDFPFAHKSFVDPRDAYRESLKIINETLYQVGGLACSLAVTSGRAEEPHTMHALRAIGHDGTIEFFAARTIPSQAQLFEQDSGPLLLDMRSLLA